MTTVALLATPPFEDCVLGDLVASTDLTAEDAVQLYEAMLRDVAQAIEHSGGSLLVNYTPREHLPDSIPEEASPKTALADTLSEVVSEPDSVRYEVQVGSSKAARVGNTVTHLLEREDESSVHVVEPTVPLLTRQLIDSASMKIRRSPVVVGPATSGRVYYTAFSDTVDFEGIYEPPAVETTVERATAEGKDVDFLPQVTPVETATDLATVLPIVRARANAGRIIPEETLSVLDELGIRVVDDAVVVDG